MKQTLFTAVLLLLVFRCLAARADEPNTVLVLADDMGYGDVQVPNPTRKFTT